LKDAKKKKAPKKDAAADAKKEVEAKLKEIFGLQMVILL